MTSARTKVGRSAQGEDANRSRIPWLGRPDVLDREALLERDRTPTPGPEPDDEPEDFEVFADLPEELRESLDELDRDGISSYRPLESMAHNIYYVN